MTPLTLGPGVRAAIEQHGRDTYPHECCGALLGDGERVVATYPLPNVTTEGPRRRFRIDDKDYLAAERQASAAGLALLGFYHSHPDHPAEPSQYDLDHAWPTFVYPIVSIRGGQPEALRAWALREDRSAFDERAIVEPVDAAEANAHRPAS
jgi:proteasome lid subunit RPN8/RPN11